ncbi:aspartate semialdehyde dehydrogenase [Trichormus variabilis ATCC 29413]|uniref:Aspartate-semialdehyde dehydrogenase n=2 Tax=Anabaena variabilis TaxID=264691 RepID=Q3M724_TRIV2|nr:MULTISPECIES: aspartate-semialdehyde dehydrogenase [Nostocaceae]ABA23212.1 aspartate semialdehyde dehydrogenase [Trichormus variabilis ATCC 29413]MBC1212804.1 aspartate-semialdehyde dehydrogenase [Trichormus variabilis ARAD]MBC1255515.1 aspartate-semialdehyde dehydrogenase [Trichormus variabilis V5]MBC1266144.1 aspartate-semialdehyde dehydrogenase [Trichormus variabilis FSR]MBC1301456.1 aspartate-semialdehyde dehydrogenase [Trichormus variabilis N2B]
MSKTYRVAILGATGAVGTELLELLESRNFPVAELKLLASERSVGRSLPFKGENIIVEAVSDRALENVDIVLASAGGSTSKAWASVAVEKGAVVIDNSSAFRMNPDVPLIVPEVNPQAAADHKGIIANPNCTTILMTLAVWPLHQVRPVQRIVAATYQSASGAGAKAMAEVKTQSSAILKGEEPVAEVLPYPLAFNLFPHNSPLTDSGYCEEELKMVNETRKIFGTQEIRITATCVRVPVLRAHSEAINLEFAEPFSPDEAREILSHAPGVKLLEDWGKNYFPMPIEASGRDEVLVGRIRQDISHPCGLELWLCGDQIRKGAALNAVQIAELLVEKNLLQPTKAYVAR